MHIAFMGRELPKSMQRVTSGIVSPLIHLLDGELQLKVSDLSDRGGKGLDVGLTGQAGGASYMVEGDFRESPERALYVWTSYKYLAERAPYVHHLLSEFLRGYDYAERLSDIVAVLLTHLSVHPQDDFTLFADISHDGRERATLRASGYDGRRASLVDVSVPLKRNWDDIYSLGQGPIVSQSQDGGGYEGVDVVIHLPEQSPRSLLQAAGEPGRSAQEVLDRYGVSVSFASYPVSRYDRVRNHIDLELWESGHAARLVEMIVHAQWAREGWSARNDPLVLARDEFIRIVHEEDTAAAVERIHATMELQRGDPNIPDAPAQREYQEGYRSALAEPESTATNAEEQAAAADQGGRRAVFRHFVDTNFRNPGADWDIAMAERGDSEWIDLFHGTDRRWADVMRSEGVHTNYPRYRCDFGQGFYLTRDRAQAMEWASWHPNPEVLHFRIRRQDLETLDRRTFSEESHELPDFVRHYRTGGSGTPHDVIEGPIIINPRSFLAGTAPEWSGNQVAFFNQTGHLLDAAMQPKGIDPEQTYPYTDLDRSVAKQSDTAVNVHDATGHGNDGGIQGHRNDGSVP
jgi:hypothetical protein